MSSMKNVQDELEGEESDPYARDQLDEPASSPAEPPHSAGRH